MLNIFSFLFYFISQNILPIKYVKLNRLIMTINRLQEDLTFMLKL